MLIHIELPWVKAHSKYIIIEVTQLEVQQKGQ